MPEARIFASQPRDVVVGECATVVDPSTPNECTLGDNVFVGPFCEIRKGVPLGQCTKLQRHSFICLLMSIWEDCCIGHGVIRIIDTFSDYASAGGNASKWKSTRIGNFVSVDNNAIIPPVTVCHDVVIGARL